MPNDGGQLTNEEIAEQFQEYGKDDFLTSEAPYSILVAVLSAVQDDFTKERITNVVREMAKKAGCPKAVFNSMLKAATPKRSEMPNEMEAGGFTGIENLLNGKQPSYGYYSCSDGGIYLYDMLNGEADEVTSLRNSIESHLIGIAAEESRRFDDQRLRAFARRGDGRRAAGRPAAADDHVVAVVQR